MSTNRSKKHFTQHQIDTAVLVARESRAVKNWVAGQARFLEVDLKSEKGKEFVERESVEAARRLLDL